MRAKAHCALWTAGLLLVAASAVLAQDAPQTVDDSSALVPEAPLTPEESAMLGNALVFDPAALATPPKKPLRLPGVSDKDFDITRTEATAANGMEQFGRSRSWSNKRPQCLRSPAPDDGRHFSFGSRLGINRSRELRKC
jgi:hypothetical protein